MRKQLDTEDEDFGHERVLFWEIKPCCIQLREQGFIFGMLPNDYGPQYFWRGSHYVIGLFLFSVIFGLKVNIRIFFFNLMLTGYCEVNVDVTRCWRSYSVSFGLNSIYYLHGQLHTNANDLRNLVWLEISMDLQFESRKSILQMVMGEKKNHPYSAKT